MLKPRIEAHAKVVYRSYNRDTRTELTAECVALGWRWFTRLLDRGKDPSCFAATFATLVVLAVKSGRRLCGNEPAKEVLSPVAQARHGFRVEPLPSTRASHDERNGVGNGQRHLDELEEHLHANTQTPPPEQANFRFSFPHFLKQQTRRNRKLAKFLLMGNSGKEAAKRFGLSPGRVTQIRVQLCKEWHNMHGELAPFEALRRSRASAE
jgi:hypothetical protein